MHLDVCNVSFSYEQSEVLHGVTLRIAEGESCAVLGPSGSGKSTLLHLMAGILEPAAGEVRLGDLTVSSRDASRRAGIRKRHFGFVFQFGDLIPELSLLDNIVLPALLNGMRRRVADRRARELTDSLGIGEVVTRKPREVSGGQMQRAAIARSVIHSPDVVIADEPTGSLDSASAAVGLRLLLESCASAGAALVVATHETSVAAAMDRQVTITDGALVDTAGELA